MNKYYKIENNLDLVKDTDSNAILNSNTSLLIEHKKRKHYFNSLSNKQSELESMIVQLQERISNLEQKLENNNG